MCQAATLQQHNQSQEQMTATAGLHLLVPNHFLFYDGWGASSKWRHWCRSGKHAISKPWSIFSTKKCHKKELCFILRLVVFQFMIYWQRKDLKTQAVCSTGLPSCEVSSLYAGSTRLKSWRCCVLFSFHSNYANSVCQFKHFLLPYIEALRHSHDFHHGNNKRQ